MFSSIMAGTVCGIESHFVQVEVSISDGLPCFQMVGFLSSEVREASERVKVALLNSGIMIPPKHITVNLSPANIRKEGNAFDLPIAIGIMTALGIIPAKEAEDILFLGELGLSGEVKFIHGVLPIVMHAKEQGIMRCMIPRVNGREGKIVDSMEIIGISRLEEAITYLQLPKEKQNMSEAEETDSYKEEETIPDFKELNGQAVVKRAVEVAAAGFHHLLLIGPPGSGKTMIAKRIPGILPPLTLEESLEVSKIYSISGLLSQKQSLITKRPFLSPHHTISEQALAGGGRIPKPGVISLAHRGILFLDELPEFKRSTLEIMRQPIEDKEIHIARSYGNFSYPAEFMLVGAMNPCPCGYYPDANQCNCSEHEIRRYRNRLSGPLLDRIDIWTEAPRVNIKELTAATENESSANIRERVMRARKMQEKRYRGTPYLFNSQLGVAQLKQYCILGTKEEAFMEKLFDSMQLSARAYHRIIKVARTIADLEETEHISKKHLSEAACYRMINETYWGRRK